MSSNRQTLVSRLVIIILMVRGMSQLNSKTVLGIIREDRAGALILIQLSGNTLVALQLLLIKVVPEII